ncbi:MAG: hypothetical protein LBE56_12680 [Tannerella sp.]|jgi:hypothetical protein|nr:hypothetical protein [Tannerella sp.]
MFETYPAGAAKIADITFSLVRGGVSLNTLNNLTDATLISFIEALVPVNPANTDTDYAGTGLSSYTAPLIIMLNNAQYTNPAIIPSLGISIQNFWLDLSNDLGGSRSDWGYHVLWMA